MREEDKIDELLDKLVEEAEKDLGLPTPPKEKKEVKKEEKKEKP